MLPTMTTMKVACLLLLCFAVAEVEPNLYSQQYDSGRRRIPSAFTTNAASNKKIRTKYTPSYEPHYPASRPSVGAPLEQTKQYWSTRLPRKQSLLTLDLFLSKKDDVDGGEADSDDDESGPPAGKPSVNGEKKTTRVAGRVKKLAKKMLVKPLQLVPMPQAIAAVLKDATYAAVEEVEDIITQSSGEKELALETNKEMVTALVEEAFKPVELTLIELEETLAKTRIALEDAKLQSMDAIEAIQVAAIAQAEGAATAVAQAEKVAELQVMKDIYSNAMSDADVADLSFDDVDYDSSEMAPPFLDEDSCLVPGEPVVRVEKAPENSRRIFAGIDIPASVDDVWKVSSTVSCVVSWLVHVLN